MNPEQFLNSLVDYEKISGYAYSLKPYRVFLDTVSAPHKHLQNIILIAGTKGKGSTAAILNSCLIAHGYRVGLYTSPHLHRLHERIKINNRPISNSQLAHYIKDIKPYVKGKKDIRTFFEVLTAIAFLHFLHKKTDFSILEVGLGGRLDATNVTHPLLSVITKIGYDHTNILGSRLSSIATEKGGIIKRNTHVITVHQRPVVEQILMSIARRKKSFFVFAEDNHTIEVKEASLHGSRVKINGALGSFEAFLSLAGVHQIQNLLLALAVLNSLKEIGFEITTRVVKNGIRTTKLYGRFNILSKKPLIIFDGAHNQDSFEALHKNLVLLKIKDFSLIFGAKKNKDIRYCVRNIFPKAQEVVLVPVNNPLGMAPEDIYSAAKKYQKNLSIAPSVQEAIDFLTSRADNVSTILITGSFYLWQRDWITV